MYCHVASFVACNCHGNLVYDICSCSVCINKPVMWSLAHGHRCPLGALLGWGKMKDPHKKKALWCGFVVRSVKQQASLMAGMVAKHGWEAEVKNASKRHRHWFEDAHRVVHIKDVRFSICLCVTVHVWYPLFNLLLAIVWMPICSITSLILFIVHCIV